jgi:hypothetical protein
MGGVLFLRQSDEVINDCFCRGVIPTVQEQERRVKWRDHQSARLINFVCILKRLVRVCQRGLGIAKEPQGPRSVAQNCDPDVRTKKRR